MRAGLLGVAVALALADSSIVTLALPQILGDFDVSITTVAWTLTAFNLAFALLALPAALVSRREPRGAFVVGVVVFTAASLACGLAPSFGVLVGARCVQAAGAALLVTAALDLLSSETGSDAGAARIWVVAGVAGAALGPAVGGILTELFGWQSIFFVQVPVALVTLVALRGLESTRVPAPIERPHLSANAALFFLSGGLVAALFLLVLLLVDGWGMSPVRAGLVVTVMPITAMVAARFASRAGAPVMRMSAGIVLVAGGLTGLALLPRSSWAWTIPPQLLIGAGIGLALVALTERAVGGGADQVVHGGWTLAARHAGVVVGLLLLAPTLTSALHRNEHDALRAGTAVVIDSRIPPLDKLAVAKDVLAKVHEAGGRQLPDLRAVFADRPDTTEYRSLLSALDEQLHRAVTNAFSTPFLIAAALALLALVPVWIGRGEPL
jgi:MFS family permease